MTISPRTLGQKIWELLGIQKGDELVICRDKISGGVLVAKQEGLQNE